MVATGNLIKAVELHPILYDFNHEQYKNVNEKDKIWAEIGYQIRSSGKVAKNKWESLKHTYAEYIESHENGTPNKKKWLWADDMEWFKPYLSYPEPFSDITTNIGTKDNEISEPITDFVEPISASLPEVKEDSSDESSVNSTRIKSNNNLLQTSSSNETLKRPRIVKNVAHFNSPVQRVITHLENKITIELDAIDTLFLAHAKTVKTFSARRQIKAKMRIAEVIMDEELENLGELKK